MTHAPRGWALKGTGNKCCHSRIFDSLAYHIRFEAPACFLPKSFGATICTVARRLSTAEVRTQGGAVDRLTADRCGLANEVRPRRMLSARLMAHRLPNCESVIKAGLLRGGCKHLSKIYLTRCFLY